MAQSPEEWYKSLPPFTKVYGTAVFATTAAISFGLIDPRYLILDTDAVFRHFEIWRLVTCFFVFGKFSMSFLFQMFILVRYCSLLEKHNSFENRTADFAYFVFFEVVCLLVLGMLVGGVPILGPSFVFAFLYVWSKRDPMVPMSMFGFLFQSFHWPWVLLAFSVLIGGSIVLDLFGIAVGHFFYFLKDILPVQYGYNLLKTPSFLFSYFPSRATVGNNFTAGTTAAAPPRFTAFQGRGMQLGAR
eukprot:GILJ01000692.1.p1 GENE.GILJ01000692.1~~GILJ01000692.1.p1  ORF type:complete len:258 (-),score=34.19 GILJ01000692.1:113-844(-)